MLQITRNIGQSFQISDIAHIKLIGISEKTVKIELTQSINSVVQLRPNVFLHFLSAQHRQARFGIEAPPEILVLR
jgi:sRNA-binding carbon storage regulator CsrA